MPIDPNRGADILASLLATQGRGLGLSAAPRIEWHYNPGNFENASFRVTDGDVRLFVKLVADPTGPDVWYRHRERLAWEYRAPPILARLEARDAGVTAFVFPHLPGRAPDPIRDAGLVPQVVELLGRLHADDALAADLTAVPPPSETSLMDCLAGDFAELRARPDVTAGIDAATLEWFQTEADALTAEASRVLHAAPSSSPIHGDPWSANVLADGDDWHLLDWDGLRLGDPASDFAMAIFESWEHGADPDAHLPPDPDLRARVRFLLRAASFDVIVDPLADLTAMPAGLPGAAGIETRKRSHSAAMLRRYRRLFVT